MKQKTLLKVGDEVYVTSTILNKGGKAKIARFDELPKFCTNEEKNEQAFFIENNPHYLWKWAILKKKQEDLKEQFKEDISYVYPVYSKDKLMKNAMDLDVDAIPKVKSDFKGLGITNFKIY